MTPIRKLTGISILLACLAACGGQGNGAEQEQAAEEHTPATAEPASASSPQAPSLDARLAQADLKNGARQFIQCRACHSLNEGGPHLTGPNLWGIENAPAASKTDYQYSAALSNSGITWTHEQLDAFIKNPNGVVPNSKMIFLGIKDDQKRADLLAYLLKETSSAANGQE